MVNSLQRFRLYGVGIEGTPGTPVAASVLAAVERINFNPQDEVRNPPVAVGRAIRNVGEDYVHARGMEWSVPAFDLAFEQFPLWLSAAIKGGVTGVDLDDGGPYQFVYERELDEYATPDTLTLRRRLSNSSGHVDSVFPYALISQITIAWGGDGPVTMALSGFSRAGAPGAFTSALTLPTNLQYAKARRVRVFADSTWAGLGTTPIAGIFRNGQIQISTGLKPYHTAEGRSSLDFAQHVFDPTDASVAFTGQMAVRPSGQYETEQAAAAARSLRAVRVLIEGSDDREIAIDMALKHENGQLPDVTESDGQDEVPISMVETGDDGDHFLAVSVTIPNDFVANNP